MDKDGEAAQEARGAAPHTDNVNHATADDSDQYIDIRMRVPKALARDLLCEMMSEYSEAACCATWADDIDIDIDADARKRLGPDGDVVHCSRDMLNVALAQIHRHCGGWWSYRAPRADQRQQQQHKWQDANLAFYPLDRWMALPVPCWMRDRVAYPNADVEGDPNAETKTGSYGSTEADDDAWWQWVDSMQKANATSIDPLSSVAAATTTTTVMTTTGTPVRLPEDAGPDVHSPV
nr:hypothetical protein [Pandoravirus massiliensis]